MQRTFRVQNSHGRILEVTEEIAAKHAGRGLKILGEIVPTQKTKKAKKLVVKNGKVIGEETVMVNDIEKIEEESLAKDKYKKGQFGRGEYRRKKYLRKGQTLSHEEFDRQYK